MRRPRSSAAGGGGGGGHEVADPPLADRFHLPPLPLGDARRRNRCRAWLDSARMRLAPRISNMMVVRKALKRGPAPPPTVITCSPSSSACSSSPTRSVPEILPAVVTTKERVQREQRSARRPDDRSPLLAPPPPAQSASGRITLVLDLDETLLHSDFGILDGKADYDLPVDVDGERIHIYTRLRPGLDYFLREMSSLFEIVIYTAGLGTYARALMEHVIPAPLRPRIHVLAREACVDLGGGLIVKDLSLLNRPLERVLLVDNSPLAAILQPSSAIIVDSFMGIDDGEDTTLDELAAWLRPLANGVGEDIRPHLATSPFARIDDIGMGSGPSVMRRTASFMAAAAAAADVATGRGLGMMKSPATATAASQPPPLPPSCSSPLTPPCVPCRMPKSEQMT